MKKSILITGCSSGIGYYCALALKKRGYRVFASARKQQDVEKLIAQGLEDSIQLDLDDSHSITRAVSTVADATGGKLYALFNNGAYGQVGAVEDLSRDALRRQFETNLFGWMELTNQLLPSMRRENQGRIIQNSSVLGLVAMPFRGAYNASKFALEGLTDTLRIELADTNIQVSLIEPGPIISRFRHHSLAALKRHIAIESSVHQHSYQATIARLEKPVSTTPFTLGPEAVYVKLLHALEAKKAKPRYYVTVPTHLFAFLRRVLPTAWLDKLLTDAGKDD